MANVKKRLRTTVKSVRKFVGRANAARLSFKRRHPRLYKYGTRAIEDAVIKGSGYGAEIAVARGAYRAYKGRNRGIRFQARNALRTYGDYVANRYS